MISRLLSIIILLLLGVAAVLYLFSDDLIKKGELVEQGKTAVKEVINEKKDEAVESMMHEMQKVLDKAEKAVQEDVEQ